MDKKILDISLIEEQKSDLTFFNIDEEETNETLKALKQSYVTTNYKEETILNLQSALNSKNDDTSRELKLESYNRYNNALELANKNYITTAIEFIEKAIEINPKDVDILNLRGLLNLLKCDFSKAFESFYTGMCYGNNELSRKYVDMLSSDEFNVFLSRYNHSIRFINEDLNQESICILDSMIEEDPDLIEPYVILALLYDKLDNNNKKEYYLEKLRIIDVDNHLFEAEKKDEKQDLEPDKKATKTKKIIPIAIIGLLIFGASAYAITNKINKLNQELVKKEEILEDKSKELNNKNKELDEKAQALNDANNKIDETAEELEKKKKDLENAKTKEVLSSNESTIYDAAMKLKKNGEYEEAIKYLKQILKTGKTKQYISESIYQLALINEKIDNFDEAKTYYKKYINTYTSEDKYYDDAFYQLGMLYYNNGYKQKAKETFYGLRSEVPDSMYNNSKVKQILSE
ncbi:MAG: tetratricopeptide repeat protein [Peptostreptococcaceae bacterium]